MSKISLKFRKGQWFKVMTCHLSGAKPSHEALLGFADTFEQASVKFG